MTTCPTCEAKAALLARLILENEKLKRRLRQLSQENADLRGRP